MQERDFRLTRRWKLVTVVNENWFLIYLFYENNQSVFTYPKTKSTCVCYTFYTRWQTFRIIQNLPTPHQGGIILITILICEWLVQHKITVTVDEKKSKRCKDDLNILQTPKYTTTARMGSILVLRVLAVRNEPAGETPTAFGSSIRRTEAWHTWSTGPGVVSAEESKPEILPVRKYPLNCRTTEPLNTASAHSCELPHHPQYMNPNAYEYDYTTGSCSIFSCFLPSPGIVYLENAARK